MTTKVNQQINLRDALDTHINARSVSKSISTLMQGKRKTIDYTPYYQRNYVWDRDKGTFFIESILLGIEIPPLIMFIPTNDKRKYEVIDGRQRYETLKQFFEGSFKLTKKGLRSLTALKGRNFQSLEPEIQRLFLDTTIRIIEFSTIGDHDNLGALEDRIKKEIFWRYNSGITPLKTIEVHRAKHLNDNFTKVMDDEFDSKPEWLEKFKVVFLSKASKAEPTLEECQAKIRELLVLEHFPINNYASTSSRRDTVEWLYDLYIEESNDQREILGRFIQKVGLLHRLYLALSEREWMIYQGVYWALVVLESNDIDVDSFFDESTILNLIVEIKNEIEIFTSDSRGFSLVTNKRFKYLSNFFSRELKRKQLTIVDFSPYLANKLKGTNKYIDNKSIVDSINELDNMRLNRPDAVTKTIEDIIDDMQNGQFQIRPSYQRKEVINIKKASGIIESMLLGIPLPTIFIYRRANGISEVVDGQQRLLSILGFIDKPYKNEKNEKVWSLKRKYKLFKKLTVLGDLGGSRFNDLEENWQDRIWDFELSVVYIDEKLNKHFDPIDLFIRLNNKPYPVKDHSFEMWNSYSERSIIERIKKITDTYNDWFYYRKDNKRMDNQELLTIFSFLFNAARSNTDTVFDTVDIFSWDPRPLTFRTSKISVTEWLNEGEDLDSEEKKQDIHIAINSAESFIQKIEILVKSMCSLEKHEDSEVLAYNFTKLMGVKTQARLQKPYYVLWFLLLNIEKNIIKLKAHELLSEIEKFLDENQTIEKNIGNSDLSVRYIFKGNVESFWEKFI